MKGYTQTLEPPTPEEIKEFRESREWTQERLGEALGVHRQTIAKWEARRGTEGSTVPPAHLRLALLWLDQEFPS